MDTAFLVMQFQVAASVICVMEKCGWLTEHHASVYYDAAKVSTSTSRSLALNQCQAAAKRNSVTDKNVQGCNALRTKQQPVHAVYQMPSWKTALSDYKENLSWKLLPQNTAF